MQIFHEGEFGLGAGAPAEVERGQEVAELLAIEDHAVEDGRSGEAEELSDNEPRLEGCEDSKT